MTDSRRKLIVFGLCGAALLWSVINVGDKKQVQTADSATVAPTQSTTTTSGSASQPMIDTAEKRAGSWGADPFRVSPRRPVYSATEQAPSIGWSLSGILVSGGVPAAIINGSVVQVGDMVSGAKVVAIDERTATIENNGQRYTLRVKRG